MEKEKSVMCYVMERLRVSRNGEMGVVSANKAEKHKRGNVNLGVKGS